MSSEYPAGGYDPNNPQEGQYSGVDPYADYEGEVVVRPRRYGVAIAALLLAVPTSLAAGYEIGRPDGKFHGIDPMAPAAATTGPSAGASAKASSSASASPSGHASPSESPSAGASASASASASESPSPSAGATATKNAAAPTTQAGCVRALPLVFKVHQKIMYGVTSENISHITKQAAKNNYGGFILMTPQPISAVQKLVKTEKVAPFIATDQEGGSVQRYTAEGHLPAAGSVPENYTPAKLQALIERDDKFLIKEGVNMNLAPVVDVAPAPGKGVLGDRMISNDPKVVTKYGGAYMQAAINAGIIPVIKHFPGLGSTDKNPDLAQAHTKSYADLQKDGDLDPFKALAKDDVAIMIGNQIVAGLTNGEPATQSANAVAAARSLGNKDALLITDSLDAKAVTSRRSVADAMVKAAEAGVDVELTTTPGKVGTFKALTKVVDKAFLTAIDNKEYSKQELNESVVRIMNAKHTDACDVLHSLS